MTVQVVYREIHPKDRRYRVTCDVCEAIVDCEAADLNWIGTNGYLGCPTCDNRMSTAKQKYIRPERIVMPKAKP